MSFLSLATLFAFVFAASLGVPGSLIWIISAGALATTPFELALVICTTAIAAMLGDFTAYVLARRFSLAPLRRFAFFRKNEPRARKFFQQSGFWFVFFTRFLVTSLCAVVSYISGFERLKTKKFVTAVIAGEALYGVIYPTLGYLFKDTWNDLYNVIGDLAIIAVLIVVFVFLLERIRPPVNY